MSEDEKPRSERSDDTTAAPSSLEKKQNEQPIDLSSERMGREDIKRDILPVGNPGIPVPPK